MRELKFPWKACPLQTPGCGCRCADSRPGLSHAQRCCFFIQPLDFLSLPYPCLLGSLASSLLKTCFCFSSSRDGTCVAPSHWEALVLPRSCSKGICVFVVVFLHGNFLPWHESGFPLSHGGKTGLLLVRYCWRSTLTFSFLFDGRKALWGGRYVLYSHFIDEETGSSGVAVARGVESRWNPELSGQEVPLLLIPVGV